MCTLYSLVTNQEAIRKLFGVTLDSAGNLPVMPAVFSDWEAPVIRNHESGRELVKMRWGLPNPQGVPGINTNVRNPDSPHWRRWTAPENRCLVPATSFSEYNDKPNPASLKNPDGTKHPMAGKKDVVWFARDPSRPMFSFAGIWTPWRGDRGPKSKPIPGPHLIYAFLTCPPNAVIAPVQAKAMPVILTTPEPLPDDGLMEVDEGRGEGGCGTVARPPYAHHLLIEPDSNAIISCNIANRQHLEFYRVRVE